MHIAHVRIRNIKAIAELEWEPRAPDPTLPGKRDASRHPATGWHVVIGNNAAGKSSVLQAIAMALIGPKQIYGLRIELTRWLRHGEEQAEVLLEMTDGRRLGVLLRSDGTSVDVEPHPESSSAAGDPSGPVFSAAYGPFRRFGGSGPSVDAVGDAALARHVTLFGDEYDLGETLRWLSELKFRQLEGRGNAFEAARDFINQEGFAPSSVRLRDAGSDGVWFEDAAGFVLEARQLSDGYRSVLSMALELLRQLDRAVGSDALFSGDGARVEPHGIVLVDEIDAHLHPTWQREIGVWLQQHFPNIQFIVTTHSPLVLQAAEVGSILLLPDPGTGETPRPATGIERDRLVYGNVLDSYGTGAFGEGVTSSESSKDLRKQLRKLNVKEMTDGLSEPEKAQQEELRAAMPTSASAIRPGQE